MTTIPLTHGFIFIFTNHIIKGTQKIEEKYRWVVQRRSGTKDRYIGGLTHKNVWQEEEEKRRGKCATIIPKLLKIILFIFVGL